MINMGDPLSKEVRGNVAIEAAIIFPVIVLLLTSIIDLSRYYRAQLQLNNAATAIADSLAQKTSITDDALTGYINLLEHDEALMNYELYYRFLKRQFRPDETEMTDIYRDDFAVQEDCIQSEIHFEVPVDILQSFNQSQKFMTVSICAVPKTGAFLNPIITSFRPMLQRTVAAPTSFLGWR